MQNHLTRPTGSLSKPEANAVSSSQKNEGKGKGPQKAPWKGKNQKVHNFKKKEHRKSKKTPPGGEYGKRDQECYKCGMKGHWSRICRTPKHIVKLYQELKAQLKNNQHEAHFVSTKKMEIGECSKSKDREQESSEPEEKEEIKAPEKTEDVPADITSNDSWDVIMKNLEGMSTDMETDDIQDEVEDVHGDSI
jgi:hypothetical protein